MMVKRFVDAGARHTQVLVYMESFCQQLARLYLEDISTDLDQLPPKEPVCFEGLDESEAVRVSAYRMAWYIMFPLHKCYVFLCCKGQCSTAVMLKNGGGLRWLSRSGVRVSDADFESSAFAFRMHLLSLPDVDLFTKRRAHSEAVEAGLLSDTYVGYRSVEQYVDTQLYLVGISVRQAAEMLGLQIDSLEQLPKATFPERAKMLLEHVHQT